MRPIPYFLTLMLFWIFASCSGSHKNFRTASPIGHKNPLIRGIPDQKVGHHVTLKSEALGQHFLMTSSYIHHSTPFPKTLSSKVIRFKKRGSELFMFESLAGKSYADTNKDILLTRFAILNEIPGEEITFDFEKGMKLFSLKHSFYVEGMNPEGISFIVSESYVESVQLKESHILINHSIRISDGDGDSTPLSLRYSLSSYNPDPNFKPSTLNKIHASKVGYFQVSPVLVPNQAEPRAPLLKFNPDNFPYTYYLSPNIPINFIPAVRDGILYWNRVSGKEIFKVEMLPDTIDPHDPGNHIVYWLENIEQHNKIGGLADITGDPLTGEIIQSRVYIPAHIITGYTRLIANYIISENQLAPTPEKVSPKTLTPYNTLMKKLASHHPYHKQHHHHHAMAKTSPSHLQQIKKYLNIFAQKNHYVPPQLIRLISQKITEDSLRQTVAHEVGHVLGLRHNFAASTQTDLNNHNYDEVLQNYIKTGTLPQDFVLSSSVMDYYPNLVDALHGAHIRKKGNPLIYDREAILHLYYSESNPLLFTSPFCSEDHMDHETGRSYYQDCNEHDTFSNPTAWYHRVIHNAMEYFPSNVVIGYRYLINALNSSSKEYHADTLEFIRKYPLSPKRDATSLSYLFDNLAHSISREAQFVQVKHKYFDITGLNQDVYTQETQEFINKNIAEFVDVSKLLLDHLSPPETKTGDLAKLKITSSMEQTFETLLEKVATAPALPFSPDVPEGEDTEENSDKAIVEEQLELIEQQVKSYLQIFEKEFLLRSAQFLKLNQFAVEDESFAENLSSFVERILFEKSPQLLDSFDGTNFYFPQFEYHTLSHYESDSGYYSENEDLRKEVLSLLVHDFYPQNPHYKKEMEEFSKNIFKQHLKEVKNLLPHENELPDKLYNWMFFEKQRFDQLNLNDMIKEIMDTLLLAESAEEQQPPVAPTPSPHPPIHEQDSNGNGDQAGIPTIGPWPH